MPIFSFFLVLPVHWGPVRDPLRPLGPEHRPPAFASNGTGVRLTLPDAIYFSFVTLSTIGYGDITPIDAIARVMVIAEIIFGVVLLLFAFSEFAAYSPEADLTDEDRSKPRSDIDGA